MLERCFLLELFECLSSSLEHAKLRILEAVVVARLEPIEDLEGLLVDCVVDPVLWNLEVHVVPAASASKVSMLVIEVLAFEELVVHLEVEHRHAFELVCLELEGTLAHHRNISTSMCNRNLLLEVELSKALTLD